VIANEIPNLKMPERV
jgi:hypothetical protein